MLTRHFAAAVAFNERLGARPQLAYTRHAYGRTLLARGKPEDATLAKNLLARALSDADLLGMRRLSENVRATRAHKRLA